MGSEAHVLNCERKIARRKIAQRKIARRKIDRRKIARDVANISQRN